MDFSYDVFLPIILIVILVGITAFRAHRRGEDLKRDKTKEFERDLRYEEEELTEEDRREIKEAGNIGEDVVSSAIKQVMTKGDVLLRNVELSYEGKEAELDCVVVNKYGVFIFEVKNYSGTLEGGEEDHEWKKIKETDSGNVYEKMVRNPLQQLKREVHILAKTLQQKGINVWVEGYAVLPRANSPIESDRILESITEIENVIHTPGRYPLSQGQVEKIAAFLK